MQEGFVPDEGYGGRHVAFWVAGKPEKGILDNVKVRRKEQYSIQSFRCTKCGYIEFYAPAGA